MLQAHYCAALLAVLGLFDLTSFIPYQWHNANITLVKGQRDALCRILSEWETVIIILKVTWLVTIGPQQQLSLHWSRMSSQTIYRPVHGTFRAIQASAYRRSCIFIHVLMLKPVSDSYWWIVTPHNLGGARLDRVVVRDGSSRRWGSSANMEIYFAVQVRESPQRKTQIIPGVETGKLWTTLGNIMD